jgi:hypothetical protein
MEKKYFALSSSDNNKIVKIIQVVFGFVCLAVAGFWLFFNVRAMKSDKTLWITIVFLSGFGFYQIWTGLGKAIRFIEISMEKISIKKTILLPPVILLPENIEKIEIYPLNLIFFLHSKKKMFLRFGTTYQDLNEQIKDEIILFAETNSINAEFVEEKL